MSIPTPGFLLSAFIQVCRRFPGVMLCTVLGTVACFALIDNSGPSDSEEFFARNWIVCQLGLPFLTALVVYSESKGWDNNRGWLLQALGFAALLGCWFWLDTKADNFEWQILPQYLALVLVMHLAVAVAPYLNTRSVRDFWEYNRQLFANLVIGSAFTLILFAGLALAILAVNNLFGFSIREQIYAKLFVLLTGIFNTAYFLFHFPAVTATATATHDTSAHNWVFRNLCKYILIPIVILYFLILYAYGAKIALQASLPQGWISSLVIGFSIAGIFTYLLNFYLAEEDGSLLVKGFKRWFWWVLIPLTGLLFIAIGKRISDYGVTEERFLVAELGVWLAASCLYFLVSKNDNIKFIPISLALFALVWAFGPLSAFAVSERSQKGVLIEILTRTGRFENGKMKPGTIPLTASERDQLSSTLEYLSKRDALSELLPITADSLSDDFGGLLDWLRIESPGLNGNHTINISEFQSHEPLPVRGFDFAFKVELYPGSAVRKDEPGMFFGLSEDGTQLEWWQIKDGKSGLIEKFSLLPVLENWAAYQDKGENNTYASMALSDRTFKFSGQKGTLQWIAETAQMEIDGTKKRLESSSGWILLKEK
ncbi:MAG: DUF4153 domain-containing protein [Saprospiraceae bacterium]|nr:DUF4153 domain-containing protein [Saprospiraceae bacterium]